MGFRFSLQSANTVANLTFGKTMSCYRDIFESRESYDQFIFFLDSFEERLYSSRRTSYLKKIDYIKYALKKYGLYERERDSQNEIYAYSTTLKEGYDVNILKALNDLSEIFNECKIKALLLAQNSNYDDFIHSERILRELAYELPGNECLILQPEDCGASNAVYNVFPHFEIALRQADLWPAVLFWDDKDDCAFVPVSNAYELKYLFEIVKYNASPMSELKRYAFRKETPQKYLIQLSDLHIGDPKITLGKNRIKVLLQKHLSEINQSGSAKVIVTGDAVDSPSNIYESDYEDFSEYIQLYCGQKPIRILGNHDINRHGIALSNKQKNLLANLTCEFPRIEILEDEKIILLLFNSNTSGSFAQGKIGEAQMTRMGNDLDKINNLEQYHLIAVLHHHITQIPRPDFFTKRVFQNLTEKTLVLKDADIFLQWLKRRNVKVVLHGHKHIPFFIEKEGINIIACGSSTGQVAMKEAGKTYISYNIIKLNKSGITCSQFIEDMLGAGEQNIRTEKIMF